jgi:hypothetical protein
LDQEEIMSTRNIVAALVVAVSAGPLLADIPDGHGGRTSPQATPQARVMRTSHACCPRHVVKPPAPPASPAEIKALGELAWNARHGTSANELIECYKMTSGPAPRYASSAEQKAIGHARRAAAPAKADSAQCCDSLACPMRSAS